ncbi:small GTP-binding protein domain protein [Pyrobaculum oguniense TE7]|uniref:Small GTP-binding protein domain protein n=1 Tax=Pyrobaculum oguniense (strain DSM 13380 / JCM 10595 / TE7) TaxID=698757 RepID=H6QAX9_PYROT|nr:small GTP-binding protein domain protein [Pyrobaculum oguniense TE7]
MVRRVALVGPPNVGKSSLFFALTGRYVKTANYPGTTLEVNVGKIRGTDVEVVDLPGVFNPSNPRDEDEKLAVDAALSYDIVVVVGAPHALKEALELVEYFSKFKPVALVLNMVDIGKPEVPAKELSTKLGIPVFYTSAVRRVGVAELAEFLKRWAPGGPTPVKPVEIPVKPSTRVVGAIFSRPLVAAVAVFALSMATAFFMLAVLEGVLPWGAEGPGLLPAIEPYLDAVREWILAAGLPPLLTSSLAYGLWTGVSALLGFLPYVLVAVALMALYEESGVIGLLTRTLESRLVALGIPGRGLLCLAVGATCNVPALSTAKVIWGRGNRVLTALLVPYVPCAARLSLFVAIATAVLSNKPLLVPFAVLVPYAVSAMAILGASAVYRSVFKTRPLVEGLPPTPLMLPNWRIYLLKIWLYFKEFLYKAGLLIVALPIALWPLTAFGPAGPAESPADSWMAVVGRYLDAVFAPLGIPWQISASLIAGYIFKEVVWGFMEAFGAVELLPSLSLPSAMALLVFLAMYSACIATTAALIRIVGWRLTLTSLALQLALGLTAAYTIYYAATALLMLSGA